MIRRFFFLMVILVGFTTMVKSQITSAGVSVEYNTTNCTYEVYYTALSGSTVGNNPTIASNVTGLVIHPDYVIQDLVNYYPANGGVPASRFIAASVDYNGRKYVALSLPSSSNASLPELSNNQSVLLFSFTLDKGGAQGCVSSELRFYGEPTDPSPLFLNGADLTNTMVYSLVNTNTVTDRFPLVQPDLGLDTKVTLNTDLSIDLTSDASSCSIQSYSWEGPNSYSSDQEDVTISPYNSSVHDGVYTVTVTDALNCTSTASATVMALPVKYTDISLKNENNHTVLTWSTAEEINCQEFIVQRSIDGTEYQDLSTIGCKDANGADYKYTDSNLETGVYYYRLLQIDVDGQQHYSNSLAVNISSSTEQILSSVNNQIVSTSELGDVLIYNMQGQLIMKKKNVGQSINIDQLNGGVYVLISNINGVKTTHKISLVK